MGNKIPEATRIGTIGELLLQLRLLEYGIQATPPAKDSGNDLIAIKGYTVRYIQVKTSSRSIVRVSDLPDVYHIVAVVELKYSKANRLLLDQSKIFVFKKDEMISQKRELTRKVVDEFWGE